MLRDAPSECYADMLMNFTTSAALICSGESAELEGQDIFSACVFFYVYSDFQLLCNAVERMRMPNFAK